MATLPDDHYVWHFSDATLTYYTNEEDIGEDLNKSEDAALNDFIGWYDNHLHVMAAIKNHAAKTFSLLNCPRTGDWESFSVEPITGKTSETQS